MTKTFRYAFYFLFFIILCSFRYNLDIDYPFVASDGAIKYYQAEGYSQNGVFNLECLYPAKELDPEFQYFPINYPWAVFLKDGKFPCVFQYPPFFSLLGTILTKFSLLPYSLYIPLLFYFLNILLFDSIFCIFANNKNTKSIFFLNLFHFIAFPLLTIVDYSENSIFHFFNLLAILFFSKYFIQKKKASQWQIIGIGLLWGIAAVFRVEVIVSIAALLFIYFLFSFSISTIGKYISMGIGFFIVISLFVYFNIVTVGEPLGLRFLSQLDNDKASLGILGHLKFAKAYLWGDEYMIGLFRYVPFLFSSFLLFIPSLFRKSSFHTKIFLLSGILYFLIASLSVTVYGGTGQFGLRYMEGGFIFAVIGLGLFWKDCKPDISAYSRVGLYLLFFYLLSITWKNTKEGLKIIRNSSADYKKAMRIYSKAGKEGIIIHSSLYSSYFLGSSFLEHKHMNLYDSESCGKILKQLKKKTPIVLVTPPKNQFITPDIPKKLYPRYSLDSSCPTKKIKILETTEIRGLQFQIGELK